MIKKQQFPVPEGVAEVDDEYSLNLIHYELLNLKPKGTILFAGEKSELHFQFFAGPSRADGLFARFEESGNIGVKRSGKHLPILDYLQKYPRTEGFVTIKLLQFRIMFLIQRLDRVIESKQFVFRMEFPTRFLQSHRRKYIRIPFNDAFPASLSFHTDKGVLNRKLKDLSREGLRIKLEAGDEALIPPGTRLKQATLNVLNREVVLGVIVVAHYPVQQAGLKIVAMSEDDQAWLREFVRVLMKQILKISDPKKDSGTPDGSK